MIAINTIRADPHYRHAAFNAGLQRLGYTMVSAGKPSGREDILVTWNRQPPHEAQANEWESLGGTVLVVENAYMEPVKNSMYAISVHGHCGSGWFPVGDEDRFQHLSVELQPWHEGGYILVCGQRGIGSRLMASPAQWESRTAQTLKAMGHKSVKVRQHPGRFAPATSLEADLSGAAVCIVWSSASGVKALALGVPVIYCAPHWICDGAARHGLDGLTAPVRDDTRRRAALHRLSHGQWTVEEIQAGEPFARIMAGIGDAKWGT